MRYHEHQSFVPVDPQQHELGNRGRGVPDYCTNCGCPFMRHYNGKCPVVEEKDD